LSVRLALAGSSAQTAVCGPGCYRATLSAASARDTLSVDVRGGQASTRWSIELPATWPSPDASTLMARATAVWLSLRTLTFIDRLSSGPGQEVTTHWQMVAPYKIAYQASHLGRNESDAVIIGNQRWDKLAGGKWTKSVQDPRLKQPVPFWVSVSDAHLLGEGTFAGRPVWYVSFFDPGTPAWFSVDLDKATLRTLDLRMITTEHFMHDTYESFDTAVNIESPDGQR